MLQQMFSRPQSSIVSRTGQCSKGVFYFCRIAVGIKQKPFRKPEGHMI